MEKPKYCPNCGEKYTEESLVKEFTELIFNYRQKDEITLPAKGWAVECVKCKWHGEISPDE